MSSARAALLAMGAALLGAPSAIGDGLHSPPPSIGIVALGCGAELPEVSQLSDRLSVEIAPVRVEARSTPPVLEVATSCQAVESMTFRDASTTRTLPVSLEDVAPELRPVALAVLTEEFLRSIWEMPETATDRPPPAAAVPAPSPPAPAPTAVQAPPTSPPPSSPPPPSPPLPVRDRSTPRPVARGDGVVLGAGPLLRYFTGRGSFLGGAELSLRKSLLFAGANLAAGSAHDDLGNVTLGVLAGSFGIRAPFTRGTGVRWSGIAAAEVGWSWAAAVPEQNASSGGSTAAVFAALTLGPELDFPVGGAFGMSVGIRAGFARGVAITADRREIASTQGFMLLPSAALHYAL